MESTAFHRFSKFPAEVRILIWKQAFLSQGPRIVEVRECHKQHGLMQCYCKNSQELIQHGHKTTSECCIHGSPADSKACGCGVHTLSNNDDAASEGEENPGHPRGDRPHIHRCRHSPPSPLFFVNLEARHEAQQFGSLIHHGEISSNLLPRQAWTTYFSFSQDTLVIGINQLRPQHPTWGPPNKSYISGLERVKHLILLDVDGGIYDVNSFSGVESLVEVLQPLTELQSVRIGLMTEGYNLGAPGSGKIAVQEWRQMNSKSMIDGMEILREQFDWLRTNLGGKPISDSLGIDLVWRMPGGEPVTEDEYENEPQNVPWGAEYYDAHFMLSNLLADVANDTSEFWRIVGKLGSGCGADVDQRCKDWLERCKRLWLYEEL